MIDLMLQRASEQLFANHFDRFATFVLRPHGHFVSAPNLITKPRQTQTTLFSYLRAFLRNDLRIDENELLALILAVATIDHGDAIAHPNLRGGKPDASCRIHGFPHISD